MKPTDRHHVLGRPLAQVSDEQMKARLGQVRGYTVAVLRRTAAYHEGDASPIVWEHGRRNFALVADGVLSIVLPVGDDSDWAGVGVFDATPEETAAILDADPAVEAGIFGYELHPARGFPGSSLPGAEPMIPPVTPGGHRAGG